MRFLIKPKIDKGQGVLMNLGSAYPLENMINRKNCLSYLGATIWNNFETGVKKSKNCNTFKHKIKENFFKQIKNKEENIYTDRYI